MNIIHFLPDIYSLYAKWILWDFDATLRWEMQLLVLVNPISYCLFQSADVCLSVCVCAGRDRDWRLRDSPERYDENHY